MRILFCGTPDFAVQILRPLAESRHRVVGVLTQPEKARGRGGERTGSPVAQAAQTLGLPVHTGSPSKSETLEWIKKLAPDAAVVAAYGRIFKKDFLELPPLGVLNIHPSLLPRWRGASPIHSAILAGDATTGVCVMKLVEELDAGPVYARKEIPILPEDDRGSLEAKLAGLGAELLISVLDQLRATPSPLQGEGKRERVPNPISQSASGITYCKKLSSDDEQIKWMETAQACWNRVRAFAPVPGAQFSLPLTGREKPALRSRRLSNDGEGGGEGTQSEICKVLKAWSPLPPLPPSGGGRDTPGTVVGTSPDKGLLVSCGEGGVLNLLRVRPAGKKDQNGMDLLNGKKVQVGDILPS